MLQAVKGSTAPSMTEPDLRTALLRVWGGGIGALRLREADADKINWDITSLLSRYLLSQFHFSKVLAMEEESIVPQC